jgi:hypothetical protein
MFSLHSRGCLARDAGRVEQIGQGNGLHQAGALLDELGYM